MPESRSTARGCVTRRHAVCLFVALLAWVSPFDGSNQALAQSDTTPEMPDLMGRNEFMLTGRVRAVALPGLALDPFFDRHATHWSDGNRNLAYGGQFTWRIRNAYELGVAIDKADLSMPSQFWLQKDKAPEKSEYTEIDISLVSIVFTSHWYWDPADWISPYLGVGLGVGLLRGDILQSTPAAMSQCKQDLTTGSDPSPASCFDEDGEVDPTQFTDDSPSPAERQPPVVPVLNMSAGLRFNIFQHGVIRLEVGLQDHLYAGVGIGGQWW